MPSKFENNLHIRKFVHEILHDEMSNVIQDGLNNLSIAMMIFECLKSFIFLLYEINRLSSFYCINEKAYRLYFLFQLLVIYIWVLIFIIRLGKLKYRTYFKSIIEYEKV